MQPTQNTAVQVAQPSRRWDGRSETDAERRYFDLRAAGYCGPIDQHGHPALSVDPDDVPRPGIATTLRCAARYLSRHGWTQAAYYHARNRNPSTPVACIAGAVVIVCYGFPVDEPPAVPEDLDDVEAVCAMAQYTAAIDYLDDYLRARHGLGAYAFNDVPGRTATQVIVALLDVADDWDATCGGAQ